MQNPRKSQKLKKTNLLDTSWTQHWSTLEVACAQLGRSFHWNRSTLTTQSSLFSAWQLHTRTSSLPATTPGRNDAMQQKQVDWCFHPESSMHCTNVLQSDRERESGKETTVIMFLWFGNTLWNAHAQTTFHTEQRSLAISWCKQQNITEPRPGTHDSLQSSAAQTLSLNEEKTGSFDHVRNPLL
jgi:hypothetical protein